MTTAAQVIKASLQRIVVQASEAPIEAAEASDFIFAMNNYMFDLDASGIALGYTVVSGLADEITIPPGAIRGLIANMAIEVAPDYDAAVVNPALVKAASEGMDTMQKLAIEVLPADLPETLPIGSGNEDNSGIFSRRFYGGSADAIAAETSGNILLEDE